MPNPFVEFQRKLQRLYGDDHWDKLDGGVPTDLPVELRSSALAEPFLVFSKSATRLALAEARWRPETKRALDPRWRELPYCIRPLLPTQAFLDAFAYFAAEATEVIYIGDL